MTVDTNLDKSSPKNFKLILPIIPEIETIKDVKELSINIHSTILPSMSLAENEAHWQGTKAFHNTSKLEFGDFNVDFIVDSKLLNWYILYKWLTYINNNKDKMAEIPQNYMIDSSLLISNNFNIPIMKVIFHYFYITTLNDVIFSYRDGDAILESSAIFRFSYFEAFKID